MRKSRIISLFFREIKIRPVFFASILILILFEIYVNYIYKIPGLRLEGEYCYISGKVCQKSYDEKGDLSYIIIGDALCYVNKENPEPSLGDIVTVYGKISSIESAMNKGEFNKQKYYASNRVFFSVKAEQTELIKEAVFPIREKFLCLKKKIALNIANNCTLEGGTINTLLLADKSGLSTIRENLYKRAGVAHFLVISGLHISAIGTFIYSALKKTGINRSASCFASLTFLILYGVLTGFSISIVRAVVMFGIRLLADILRRVYDILNAVSVAMIVALFYNPLVVWNQAFIYSYSTVFAIAVYLTYIHPKAFQKRTAFGKIRESLRIPVVLFLFIMPVSLYNSYQFSVGSIIINALLAPFCAPILTLSFLAAAFCLLKIYALAGFFDFLLALLLRLLDGMCKLSVATSFFLISGKPVFVKVIVYYIFLFTYFLYIKENQAVIIRMIFLISNIIFLCEFSLYTPTISMLSVGQGECLVIKTGSHSAVIVDCGSTSKSSISKNIVVPFLKYEGITKLFGIYSTHSDKDHMGEISILIEECIQEGISVGRLLLPDLPENMRDEMFLETVKAANDKNIPISYLISNVRIDYGAVSMNVLWPKKNKFTGDSNRDSLVLLLRTKNMTALFTGDATSETEREIAAPSFDIDVLKVSHHGSGTGTCEELIQKTKPEIAIISAGKNNRYGHPHAETVSMLEKYNVVWKCTKDFGELDVENNRIETPFVYGSKMVK